MSYALPTQAQWSIALFDGVASFDFELAHPLPSDMMLLLDDQSDLEGEHRTRVDDLEKMVCYVNITMREIRRRGLENDPAFRFAGPGAMGFVTAIDGVKFSFDHTRAPPLDSRFGGLRMESAMTRFDFETLDTLYTANMSDLLTSVVQIQMMLKLLWRRGGYKPIDGAHENLLSDAERTLLRAARAEASPAG